MRVLRESVGNPGVIADMLTLGLCLVRENMRAAEEDRLPDDEVVAQVS